MINWPSMFPEWTPLNGHKFPRYSHSNWPIWFWQNHLFSRKILWPKNHKPISKIMVGHRPNFQKWLLTDQFQKDGWPPTKFWKMVAHRPISKKMVGHQPKFEKWLLTNQFQKLWLATDQNFKNGCSPTNFKNFGWPPTKFNLISVHTCKLAKISVHMFKNSWK